MCAFCRRKTRSNRSTRASNPPNLSFRTERTDAFAFPIHSDESVGSCREKSLFDRSIAPAAYSRPRLKFRLSLCPLCPGLRELCVSVSFFLSVFLFLRSLEPPPLSVHPMTSNLRRLHVQKIDSHAHRRLRRR